MEKSRGNRRSSIMQFTWDQFSQPSQSIIGESCSRFPSPYRPQKLQSISKGEVLRAGLGAECATMGIDEAPVMLAVTGFLAGILDAKGGIRMVAFFECFFFDLARSSSESSSSIISPGGIARRVPISWSLMIAVMLRRVCD